MAENFWIFGYGSLIWNPTFPYVKSVCGFIKGFSRRFYQGSTDHRGLPGKPGRVVTLLTKEDIRLLSKRQILEQTPKNECTTTAPFEGKKFFGKENNLELEINENMTSEQNADYEEEEEEFVTWGIAYCVLESKREEVIAYLDYRERGGYTQYFVDVYSPDLKQTQPIVESALVYLATTLNPNFLGPACYTQMSKEIVISRGPSGANLEYFLKLANSLREINAVDNHIFTLEKYVLKFLETYPESIESKN